MKFTDLISRYVIKNEREKKRHRTRDDFDLGPGWAFLGGWYRDREELHKNDWMTAWGVLQPGWDQKMGCRIDSVEFLRGVDGTVRASVRDQSYIGNRQLPEPLEMADFPAELLPVIKGHKPPEPEKETP